jgi:hypothetical protein
LHNNLSTPKYLDPLWKDTPPLLGRDGGVDPSVVELVVVGHVDIAYPCMQASYFFIMGLEGTGELVNIGVGSNGGVSFDGGGEAKCYNLGQSTELLLTEAHDGLGQARG